MRMTPNLNGTGVKTLCEQRKKIIEQCDKLIEAIKENFIHPRDYQFASKTAYEHDSMDWHEFVARVDAFRMARAHEYEELMLDWGGDKHA